MSNELAVQDTAQNNRGQVNFRAGFSSITGTDLDTRKKVYKAVTSPESLKKHLGEEINVVDVIAMPIDGVNEKTGALDPYVRFILIADDGVAYSASSSGVENSLNTVFAIFGEPAEWPAGGLTMVASEEQSPNNKNYQFLSIDVI